jgi:hypothetical protein
MHEGIYLLKKEHTNVNDDFYKLGRSFNLHDRIKNYPKNSKLYLVILCKKSVDRENDLIKLLSLKFKFKSNNRSEYFTGNIDDIILEFQNYFKNINCVFCKITNEYTSTFAIKNIIDNVNVNKIVYNPINIKDTLINQINYFSCDNAIKHICKVCDYSTQKKNNFDKHCLTEKHINNKNGNNKKENNTNNDTLINKIEILTKQIEQLRKNYNIQNANNQNIPNIVNEPRNIKKSLLSILNSRFRDTPPIDYINETEFRKHLEEEYNLKLDDENNKLFLNIFSDYKNKKLVHSMSNVIIRFLKKTNQKTQSVFNIDSSRGNYATKVQNIWYNDKQGMHLKKYTIECIIIYMSNIMDLYKLKLVDIIDEYEKKEKEEIISDLNEFLTNPNTHKKIILNMCSELRMDDILLESLQ